MVRFQHCLLTAALLLAVAAPLPSVCGAAPLQHFDGFNVIESPEFPFGSASAWQSLTDAKRLGARAIAVVPFFWQASPGSPELVRGKDMSDDELRAAIDGAHALGLGVLVKPQVWVPKSWAGAIAMTSDTAWRQWFAAYRIELDRVARIAEERKAEAFAIGTELAKTSQRPEWQDIMADIRRLYSGRLLYVAHNVDEAQHVPFWDKLDLIGVTLYPPLGADRDEEGRRAKMREAADQLDRLAAQTGKTVLVAEIGLRSAQGAAAKPWESVEERPAPPDPMLQSDVLGDWLSVLARPSIGGVLIWRWFTAPNAGGLTDTDFTVQGKPAEQILMCAWTRACAPDVPGAD